MVTPLVKPIVPTERSHPAEPPRWHDDWMQRWKEVLRVAGMTPSTRTAEGSRLHAGTDATDRTAS